MDKQNLDFSRTEVFRMGVEMKVNIQRIYETLGLPYDPATQFQVNRVKSARNSAEYAEASNVLYSYLATFGSELTGKFRERKPDEPESQIMEEEEGKVMKIDFRAESGRGIPAKELSEYLLSAQSEAEGISWGSPAQLAQIEREAWDAPSYAEAKEIYDLCPIGAPERKVVLRVIAYKFFQKPPDV